LLSDPVYFNPATEPDKDRDFPPWNVILPIRTTARAFDDILALPMTVFGDKTQFGQLGT